MDEHREKVIEIRGLEVEYQTNAGKHIRAVSGLDLEVYKGEVVGFIGPNGAGKSTTIKVLLGFRRPTKGSALIFDRPAGGLDSRRRIGFLPEVALYYPFLTARETLLMFATLREVPKADRAPMVEDLLRKVGLKGRENEPVRNFSKGMLQRVGIAQAIMGEPELLILDEVTSGLDPVARYDVRSILLDFKAKGKTVFFSSHELSEVTMLCDRVILIDEGKLLVEDRIDRLANSIRRHAVCLESRPLPHSLPEGAFVQSVNNGTTTIIAGDKQVLAQVEEMLREMNAKIVDVREEAGTLEDFFVHKIGHKVS